MDFPTKFSMKVVGAAEANLESIIVAAIRNNNIEIETTTIVPKDSSAGKYTSFTVTFNVDSQEQLDNVYRELSGNPQIIMVL